MPSALVFSLIVLGFSGIVAQTVLIRESLIVFSGNELSIGVIIGTWVVWEALGAYAGGRLQRKDTAISGAIVTANILFTIFLPATIAAIRILKIIIGVPPEMSLSITAIFGSSLFIFLPCAFAHGFSFTASCRIYEAVRAPDGTAAGRGYCFEMAGTVIGGLAVSYIFIPWMPAMRIAFLTGGIMSLSCLLLGAQGVTTRSRRAFMVMSILGTAAAAICMAFSLDKTLEERSINAAWHNRTVISYENSHYQNIVVTKDRDQYTFFTDGTPMATLPVPDIVRIEEIVHMPGLAHGLPQDVLVIQGGAGGIINEILKYPGLRHIDYVEIDPSYLRTMARFPSELVRSELGDDRVNVHYDDGRRFVKKTSTRYDIVLSGIPSPRTLQANRFFTEEFFREVMHILKPDGVFVFTLPGSLAYYDRELKDMNASILHTARGVFKNVAVIPGSENLFMASPSRKSVDLSVQRMDRRLKENAIPLKLISLPHLSFRLDPERAEWFRSAVKGSQAKANHDLTPMGLFYAIAFDSAVHNPSLKPVFVGLERYGPALFFLLSALLAAVAAGARQRLNTAPVLFVTLTTGFAVMVLELLLVFIYQVYSGYVFHEIGMLITMLMTGMAAGAISAGWFAKKLRAPLRALIAAETALAALCLIIPVIFLVTGLLQRLDHMLLRCVFLTLLFVSGFFAGLEFPVAVEVYRGMRPDGTAVGAVYGIDLIGGFFGGIAGGFFLFPVMGLVRTCIFLFAVKVCGILMLFYRRRK